MIQLHDLNYFEPKLWPPWCRSLHHKRSGGPRQEILLAPGWKDISSSQCFSTSNCYWLGKLDAQQRGCPASAWCPEERGPRTMAGWDRTTSHRRRSYECGPGDLRLQASQGCSTWSWTRPDGRGDSIPWCTSTTSLTSSTAATPTRSNSPRALQPRNSTSSSSPPRRTQFPGTTSANSATATAFPKHTANNRTTHTKHTPAWQQTNHNQRRLTNIPSIRRQRFIWTSTTNCKTPQSTIHTTSATTDTKNTSTWVRTKTSYTSWTTFNTTSTCTSTSTPTRCTSNFIHGTSTFTSTKRFLRNYVPSAWRWNSDAEKAKLGWFRRDCRPIPQPQDSLHVLPLKQHEERRDERHCGPRHVWCRHFRGWEPGGVQRPNFDEARIKAARPWNTMAGNHDYASDVPRCFHPELHQGVWRLDEMDKRQTNDAKGSRCSPFRCQAAPPCVEIAGSVQGQGPGHRQAPAEVSGGLDRMQWSRPSTTNSRQPDS